MTAGRDKFQVWSQIVQMGSKGIKMVKTVCFIDPFRPFHYAARAMGGVSLRQKKKEELESKSSHKSDIWLPAAPKK